MNLTSRVEIINNSTSESPRAARLIITGEADEMECQYTRNFLFNKYAALKGNKEAGATEAAAERQPCNCAMMPCPYHKVRPNPDGCHVHTCNHPNMGEWAQHQ